MPFSNFVWIADFHLASLGLLAAALINGALIRQPARRLAVAWATALGIALLLGLVVIPGWSLWSLAGSGAGTAVPAVGNSEPATVMRLSPRPGASTPPAAVRLVRPERAETAAIHPETGVKAADLAHEAALIILSLYLCGVLLAVGWLLSGWWLARRLVGRAAQADIGVTQVMESLADSPPRLLVSDRLAGPVAIGFLRPAILLPRALVERSDAAELRTALAHELAHVRGGDLWLLAGLRLLLVLLWCNPLYWMLRRRVRLDQETLADAAAADQSDRHAYAERLVGWAKELTPQPCLSGAAGLWESPSQLRKRIAVLLDDGFVVMRGSSLRWRVSCGVACLTLVVLVSLVTLGPARASEQPGSRDEETPLGQSDSKSPAPRSNRGADADVFAPVSRAPWQAAMGNPNTISGRCVDESGKPVADVEVLLFHKHLHHGTAEHVQAARTDVAGAFRFNSVVGHPESAVDSPAASLNDLYVVVARLDGYASQSEAHAPWQIARYGVNANFRLQPAGTLTGKITSADGEPVSGARVRATIEGSFDLGGHSFHAAFTDTDGRYAISDLPVRDFAAERARREQARRNRRHSGFVTDDFVAFAEDVTVKHPEYAIGKQPLDRVPAELNLNLATAAIITGRIIHDEGAPVEGLGVQIQADPLLSQQGATAPVMQSTLVDSSGRYRFGSLPAGNYYLRVNGVYNTDLIYLSGQKATAVAGDSVSAPDLVVSDGRVVRFQLLNAETQEILGFKSPLFAVAWYFPVDEDTRYGGSLSRDVRIGPDGQFEYRVDKRAVRMGVSLPLPTGDPHGVYPQFRVRVPAGEVKQPFPFPIDLRRVSSTAPAVGGIVQVARDLVERGRLDDAIDSLANAVEEKPDDPNLLLQLGDLKAMAKRYSEAISDYEAAIEQKPDFLFLVQNNLAHLLATAEDPSARDPDRAIELAHKAVAGSPQPIAQVYDTLSSAHAAAGGLKAAIKAQEKALELAAEREKPAFQERLDGLREQLFDLAE